MLWALWEDAPHLLQVPRALQPQAARGDSSTAPNQQESTLTPRANPLRNLLGEALRKAAPGTSTFRAENEQKAKPAEELTTANRAGGAGGVQTQEQGGRGARCCHGDPNISSSVPKALLDGSDLGTNGAGQDAGTPSVR